MTCDLCGATIMWSDTFDMYVHFYSPENIACVKRYNAVHGKHLATPQMGVQIVLDGEDG